MQTATLYEEIETALGMPEAHLHSDADLLKLVECRLDPSALDSLISQGLTTFELYTLVIPQRTLSHRKAKSERLTLEESDRALRTARILSLARVVFADPEKALRWLRKPKHALQDKTPLGVLSTDAGARIVEEMLYRIDEGMAA